MIVLDASALVDLVIRQRSAPWVSSQLRGMEVRAPAHQAAEVLSAIARLTRSRPRGLSLEEGQRALNDALTLAQVMVVITPGHIRRAFSLRETIRTTDGLYVALAEELGCPLVTTDRRLARSGAPCEVRTPPADPGEVPAPR